MELLVLVPKVIRSYIAQFPEVRNNAYKYFNYDNRVVDESVERGDVKKPYMGPDDFNDVDYQNLLNFAQTLADPILLKYSPVVAAEDSLNYAIRDYQNGLFDGKVNANRFNVLLDTLSSEFQAGCAKCAKQPPKKKQKKEQKREHLTKNQQKKLNIDLKTVPTRNQIRNRKKIGPGFVQERGRIFVDK